MPEFTRLLVATVSLLLFDRVVDLIDEGFDLAVRIANLPDSSLVSRHVGDVRRLLVASPAYLYKHGSPKTPEDLKSHAVIGQTAFMPNRELRYFKAGKPARITLPIRFEINDAHACIGAAEQDKGITIVMSYMVIDALRKGRLVPVLNKFVGLADQVKLKEAQAALLLTDNETTEQLAAATGSVRVTDLGMAGLMLGRAGGAAGAGWSNTNEGKVIAAAFLDAHNQLVTQLRLLQAKDLPPPVPTKAHAG